MNQTIKNGDIVIFRNEDNWLSKAIEWLTDSDVSHAAMIYDEAKIIETLAPGVCISSVDYSCGDEAYIMRLKEHLDTAPLIETAKGYYDRNTRYDFPSLVLLGGLLIYKKINLTPRLVRITDRILQRACLLLDEYIQKLLGHSDRPMVCSQFVYQVYYDCGGEYIIRLTNDSVFRGKREKGSMGMVRLVDYLDVDEIEPELYDEEKSSHIDAKNDDSGDEKMVRELYLALSEEKGEDEDNISVILENSSTLRLAELLLAKAKGLLNTMQSNLPLDAMFVTPADIVYHSVNLEEICVTKVKRVH